MSISWPADLLSAIARRRAVLLIGSGVSANAKNGAGMSPPTWGKFLDDARKGLTGRHPHISRALNENRYLEACDFLKNEYGEQQWKALIKANFLDPAYKPADIHRAIFDLDCRVVVSLNFDRIYDDYAVGRAEGTFIVKKYYDGDIRQSVAGSDRYLLKPHGSVDDIDNMIFTLSDYADARINHSHFYEILNALIHTHTILCIGCGISDPDMKLLFEDYRYKHKECPHYMTFPTPISKQEIELIRKARGINILTYSPSQNHKALTDALTSMKEALGPLRDEISTLQSW